MRCEICGVGPLQGVSTFRIGPYGIKTTQWICKAHLPEDKRNDKIEQCMDIVNILEGV